MRHLVTVSFIALAFIHFMPALAMFAPSKMAYLYGVAPNDTAMVTLLQHRALLFGLFCAAFVLAAFVPTYRWPVLIGGVVSMAGFVVIAAMHAELSGALRKIVITDIIGLVIAAIAAFTLLKS